MLRGMGPSSSMMWAMWSGEGGEGGRGEGGEGGREPSQGAYSSAVRLLQARDAIHSVRTHILMDITCQSIGGT